MIAPFDKEAIHDSKIAPLMTQIIEICRENAMPFLASFCYAQQSDDEGGETLFCTSYINAGDPIPELVEALDILRNGASYRPKMAAFTILTDKKQTNQQ